MINMLKVILEKAKKCMKRWEISAERKFESSGPLEIKNEPRLVWLSGAGLQTKDHCRFPTGAHAWVAVGPGRGRARGKHTNFHSLSLPSFPSL